jgi:predicted RNase H-like nuclease (RuvC/YqgF family)
MSRRSATQVPPLTAPGWPACARYRAPRAGGRSIRLRDFDQMVPGESVQQLVTENTSLEHRVQQLTREHRSLQERLEGARSNLRFAEKRIADLEAQLLEHDQP